MFEWINEIKALAKENPYVIMTTVFLTVMTVLALRNSALDEHGRELSDKMLEDCKEDNKLWEAKYEASNQRLINTLMRFRSKVYDKIDSISDETDSY